MAPELAALLRATPFYEWPRLRARAAAATQATFDAAATAARSAWTDVQRRDRIQEALTVAAGELILAKAGGTGLDRFTEHLSTARIALQAVEDLAHDDTNSGV